MAELGEKLLSRPNKDIYRSADGKLLIKVFNHEKVSKAEVLAEALCQADVEEVVGINVSPLREIFVRNDDWCLAYDFIEGSTLQSLMEKEPEKEDQYAIRMLELQIQMHGLTAPRLFSLTSKISNRISLYKDLIPATIRYELHVSLDAMPKHSKLCHCDFNPTNIILTPGGKYYILDWAHAANGNASCDIAITYLWFIIKGEQELADKYLEAFSRKTDTAIQYVKRWIPIAAAFMASKYTGAERDYLLSLTEELRPKA